MSKKKVSFLHGSIYVGRSKSRGRGIFTSEKLDQGTVIETAPVIVLSPSERKSIDSTLLHDYIFEWGDDRKECCVALGYISLYNHSYEANCEYEMDFKKQMMSIKTVRDIRTGEELYINYNGSWNDDKEIWFEVK